MHPANYGILPRSRRFTRSIHLCPHLLSLASLRPSSTLSVVRLSSNTGDKDFADASHAYASPRK